MIPPESIYFLGKCLTNQTELDQVRDDVANIYNCTGLYVEGDANWKNGSVFISETTCGEMDEFPLDASGKFQLFDIPLKLRYF